MTLPRPLLLLTAGLAFLVVVMGAYVRLSDAGLGCPDWPGCYGRPTPWHAEQEIAAAHTAHPHGPVSQTKAWKEMVHRYLAGTLGLSIFAIAGLSWRRPPPGRRLLPSVLAGLVVFQALLGMWTVTLQLKPAVVASHLLGGMTTLALLIWLALGTRTTATVQAGRGVRKLALAVLALVAVQIALGGWVSANYAALACPDLPTCQGRLWPEMDFAAAYGIAHPLGHLALPALTAIHMAHRIGAVLVLLGCLWLAGGLLRIPGQLLPSLALLTAVALQFLLGIGNIVLSLPLPVAVAHNAGAALLLATLVWINHRLVEARP
jgi:heme a synthase